MKLSSVSVLALLGTCSAFSGPQKNSVSTAINASTSLNRREAGVAFTAAVASAFAPVTTAVAASSDPPSKEEIERLKKGYNGILYLLENFDQETTVCRENGGECKRDADPGKSVKYLVFKKFAIYFIL